MIGQPGTPTPSARAGRFELSALVFAALFPTFGAWLYFVQISEGPLFQIAYVGCKAIQFGLPVAWLLLTRGGAVKGPPASQESGAALADASGWAGEAGRREKTEIREGVVPAGPRDGASLDVALERRGRHLVAGLLSGALIAAVIAAGYVFLLRGGPAASAAAERVAERLAAMGATTPMRYALLAVFIALLHSWLEEYYWRWFLFGRIRFRVSFGAAAALSSLAFASHHVVVLYAYLGTGPGAWLMAPLSIGVVVGGLIWAWHYERSRSILPGWVSHVMADLAIMAMGWDLALAVR